MLTDGPRVRAFAHRFVRHTKGRWAGQPLDFEPWQAEFLDEAFEIDERTGLRVYREVLLGIPRKNGKSTKAGAIGLYLLAGDGEAGPEVYVAAAALRQAGIVFGQMTAFVDASPALGDFLVRRQYHIDCPSNRGILRVLSSDAPLQHGLNPHGVIIDELHAHKSDRLYTALTSGGGAREQPLTVTLTTAGYDEEQVLGLIYNAALADAGRIEQRRGLTIVRDRDAGFLMFWYGAGPDEDPDDPAVQMSANPASWITADFLRRERTKPTMHLADFQRFHLNQWVPAKQQWLPVGAWTACREGAPDPADEWQGLDRRYPVAVGIDFGVKDDTTCLAVAQRVPMPIGRRDPETPSPRDLVVLRTKFFTPDPEHGSEADIAAILDTLRSLRVRFPSPARRPEKRSPAGPIYSYDPWGFRALAAILEGEGLMMNEVPQNDSRMVPAATDLYALATSRRLRHNGDPVLARHIANVVGLSRGEAGWRIGKLRNSSKKIDGAIASAMAVSEALRPWPRARTGAFVA